MAYMDMASACGVPIIMLRADRPPGVRVGKCDEGVGVPPGEAAMEVGEPSADDGVGTVTDTLEGMVGLKSVARMAVAAWASEPAVLGCGLGDSIIDPVVKQRWTVSTTTAFHRRSERRQQQESTQCQQGPRPSLLARE